MGVPGYPVSAVLAFELLAVPLLAMVGGRAIERPRARATAAAAMTSTPRSDEWMRLRLARVSGTLLALPLRRGAGVLSSLARADALACVPIGSDGVAEGDEIDVELLRPLDEIERSLVVAGATDPIVDELAARFDLLPDCAGAVSGATALAAGRCHLALLEQEDVPDGATVLRAWARQTVLATAPRNPLDVDGIEALRRPEVRLANRPPGSGCRRLLDRLLTDVRLDPGSVTGYRREARSQAAAVAAVAAGAADCAVCSREAAERAGLGFVPLAEQMIALVAGPGLEPDERVSRLHRALFDP
jgi:putative molybdopterin biosynthesis protein